VTGPFHRILCGVDETPEGIEAVRQAKRLAAPGAELLLVGVVDTGMAVHAGWAASDVLDELFAEERTALAVAQVVSRGGPAETRLVEGVPAGAVVRLAAEEDVDLVAVGTHGIPRSAGIVTGSVATYALHEAPCSVLVARACDRVEEFPRSIVAGFDGSAEAEAALETARQLADASGATLHVLAACGGQKLPLEAIRALAPDAAIDERPPVEALVEESAGVDLVVLGSRNLHGVAALGSVSERVAHRATCSVLVVRDRFAGRQ
jgi:nucleotide-binding universal stress UspA family protein